MLIAITFVPCCVFCSLALAALFIRHVGRRRPLVEWLAVNAYGIYLVHYVFVTWAQAALLHVAWGALIKATIVFVTALASSLALTILARQNRIANAVIS